MRGPIKGRRPSAPKSDSSLRREAKREKERAKDLVGHVVAIRVAIFAPKKPKEKFNAAPVVKRAKRAFDAAFNPREVESDNPWSFELILRGPHTHAGVARKLEHVRKFKLDGGRLHIGAVLQGGEYAPLTRAFEDFNESIYWSIDEMLGHMLTYVDPYNRGGE